MAERWDRAGVLALAPGRAARTRDAPPTEPAEPKDPKTALRRAARRAARVASGLAELDRWLCDQVRQGLAASQQYGYGHWDDIAARMVDAQAPGLAERLRALASVPHSGPGWDGRLLAEYALLRLLTVAYRRQAELPPALLATVRSRIGFTVRQAEVLEAGHPVGDHWQVLGRRVLDQERIRVRRTWLRGRETGRFALVLSFAPAGQPLDSSLAVGTETHADLVFYPGAVPLRALVQARHDTTSGGVPSGDTIAGLLAAYAVALAGDPWLDSWPAVLEATPARSPVPAAGGTASGVQADGFSRGHALAGGSGGVVPPGHALAGGSGGGVPPGQHCLRDAVGDTLPLHPAAGACWPLYAVSGGRPVTVAGEWTPRGLWPLTVWDEGGAVVPL